jgi:hypothetical protein
MKRFNRVPVFKMSCLYLALVTLLFYVAMSALTPLLFLDKTRRFRAEDEDDVVEAATPQGKGDQDIDSKKPR